jgi:molecular chaperone GrpE
VEQSEPEKTKSPETAADERAGESENIEDLKKALAEEKSKTEANLARWQRTQADFTNYKRFAEQDKVETSKYAAANMLVNILPVIDDFERAVAAIPPEQHHNKWMEGLRMIQRKFRDTLEKQGVTPIVALGMEFDPRFMDAMSQGPGKRDVVVMELEKGYKLQDKVIRPARVVVGNGEQVNKEE